ncbi:hypothetical protein LAUMK40_05959 [Mycobacterium kansasii]|nr:hypothetical protein LAUMK40_05959 [Mycobacterium kansasii]
MARSKRPDPQQQGLFDIFGGDGDDEQSRDVGVARIRRVLWQGDDGWC